MTTETISPFVELLARAGVEHTVLPHSRTERAVDEAGALGLPPHEVAKTLVVSTPRGNVRLVLLASERLDLGKVREVLGGGKEIRLLSEGELAASYPAFELGAVPPVGGATDRVIVDHRLERSPTVVLEAGRHDHSVRLRVRDLIALAQAETADLAQE